MSALCAWLVRQCDEFVSPTSGNVVQTVPSPVSPPPGRHPVPRPSRSAPAAFLPVPQRPFLVHRDQPILSVPVHPFTVAAPPAGPPERSPSSCSIRSILSVLLRSLLVHRNQPILSVLLLQQFPKCLVRRLLLPTRLWRCILVVLQHLRAVVVVDLSQKQDLHVSHGSLRCLWTIITPQSARWFRWVNSSILAMPRSGLKVLRHGECGSEWIIGPQLWAGILASVVVSSTTLRIAHCRFTELQTQFSFSFHCSRVGRMLLFLNFPRFGQTVSCQCLLWMIHMFQIHVWLEVVHHTFPLLLRPPASVLSFIS